MITIGCLFVLARVSLHRPSCPDTHYVGQACLKLTNTLVDQASLKLNCLW